MDRLDEYQAEAERTGSAVPEFNGRLALGGLGLTGEAGEVADLIKKHLFHGRALDRAQLVKELGDVLWYVAFTATTLGVPLSEVAAANVAKLRARFPSGFNHADAAAKRDEQGAK
jgi:NTP pyrophosphatase (non-canonical NTP hydrolase)